MTTTTTTLEDMKDNTVVAVSKTLEEDQSTVNPTHHPGTGTVTTTNMNSNMNSNHPPIFIPNTIEMTLLCMDYLRNQLLRNQSNAVTSRHNNDDHDRDDTGRASVPLPLPSSPQLQYISIAVWALQQSLLVTTTTSTTGTSNTVGSNDNHQNQNTPQLLVSLFPDGTDAWMSSITASNINNTTTNTTGTTTTTTTTTTGGIPWPLPNLETIYSQIHYHPVVTSTGVVSGVMEEKKMDDPERHHHRNNSNNEDDDDDALVVGIGDHVGVYDDDHSSNLYRCYNHHHHHHTNQFGNPGEPLSLDHLVTIALLALSSSTSRIHYDTQLLLGNLNEDDEDQDDPNNTMTNTTTNASSALFASYLQAVVQKGFFHDCLQPHQNVTTDNPDVVAASSSLYTITNPILYQDKFRKVVTKFRIKCTLVDEIRNEKMNHSAYWDYNAVLQHLMTSSSSSSVAVSTTNTTATNTKMTKTIHGIPIPSLYVPTAPHQQRTVLTGPSLSALSLLPNHPGGAVSTAMATTTTTNPYPHNAHYGSSIPPSESMTSYYSVIPPSSSGVIMMQNNNNTPSHQQPQQQNSNASVVSHQSQNHPSDIQEAEKYKNLGNTYMQQKLYTKAIECYTTALQYAPLSYNAHVYYSNRAAAYISCKEYANAIRDSERALMIVPTYGKGHARLGLAYFLSSQYRNAVEAYTVALKYDPENQSSKNYLEKSALRLAEQEQQQQGPAGDGDTNVNHNTSHTSASSQVQSNNSFSVISEMERSTSNNAHHHSLPHIKSGGTPNHPHHSLQPPSPSMSTAPSVSSILHDSNNRNIASTITNSSNTDVIGGNGTILKDAERYKIKGNTYMSQKDYNNAIQSYTKAIQLLPNDIQKSHVYYSNRAAAFCYLECYHDAEMDAMRAIELVPTYGKAYARLGLSRFLLKNYSGAIRAYETALQYDPNNTASQSYLIKAQQKLLLQQQQSNIPTTTASVSSGTSARSGLV